MFSLLTFFFFPTQTDSRALDAVAHGNNRGVSSLGYLDDLSISGISVHFGSLSVSMGNGFILQTSSCNKCLLLPFADNFLDNIASLFLHCTAVGDVFTARGKERRLLAGFTQVYALLSTMGKALLISLFFIIWVGSRAQECCFSSLSCSVFRSGLLYMRCVW